jgi:hypothetical protein
MKILPLTKEAKEEINFIHSLRKEEFTLHHNYSSEDTTYQSCVDLYYKNRQDVFIANNGELIGVIILSILVIYLLTTLYKSRIRIYKNIK